MRGGGGLPVVLDDGSQYAYGAGLVSQVVGANSYNYLSDGLGSTIKTVANTGAVVNAYTYDVYGKTTSSSGAQSNEFQFAGQQTDATGLQYLRARYYDPQTGGFLSRDPMNAMPGWSDTPYGYAGGRPSVFTDPGGLCFGPCWEDEDPSISVGGRRLADPASTVFQQYYMLHQPTGFFRICPLVREYAGQGCTDPFTGPGLAQTVVEDQIAALLDDLKRIVGPVLGATIPTAEDLFWKSLRNWRGQTKTDGERLYEWDNTHGDVEVYDKTGRHLGTADPKTGEMVKPARPGRRIRK